MECNSFKLCINSLEKSDKKEATCSLSECLKSYDKRNKVVVEENRKKYELINHNSDRIANFHVDGGMISSNSTIKCDNLLVDIDAKVAIFIELKGIDLKHALEQVDAMVTRLSPDLQNYRISARIITSNRTNVPNIKTCPQYIALNRKILTNRGSVGIRANIISETVANVKQNQNLQRRVST